MKDFVVNSEMVYYKKSLWLVSDFLWPYKKNVCSLLKLFVVEWKKIINTEIIKIALEICVFDFKKLLWLTLDFLWSQKEYKCL